MANAKETMNGYREERLNREIAYIMGLTYDEFIQLDYFEDSEENKDGIILHKIYKFNDDSPKHILNKIVGLDENNQFWLSIDAIVDDEYYDYEDEIDDKLENNNDLI